MNARRVLHVLGYREGNEAVALALEMDLRSCGATFDEALDDLKSQVKMQLDFAWFKRGSPDMAYFPAAPAWFALFAKAESAQSTKHRHRIPCSPKFCLLPR